QPHAGVEDAVVRGAVIALSFIIEAGDGHERTAPPAQAQTGSRLPLVPGPPPSRSLTEAARNEARLFIYIGHTVRCGPDADHAAGRVAIQRRRRSAQHFDAVDLAELEVRELALAVGQCLRNAVDEDLDPTHRERRARAKAANRDPLILREIVAVGDVDAGDVRERFVESPRRPGSTDLRAIDAVNRQRDLCELYLGASYRDRCGRRGLGFGGVLC